MGRPLPGYRVLLLDTDGKEAKEARFVSPSAGSAAAGLMQGYATRRASFAGATASLIAPADFANVDEDGT